MRARVALNHCLRWSCRYPEKVFFIASLMAAAGSLVMAATRETCPITPEVLAEGARKVAEHIRKANRDTPGPWASALARCNLSMPHGRLLMAPGVRLEPRKRETPDIMTVRDLQTHFVRGVVRLRDEPARDARVDPRRPPRPSSRHVGGVRGVLLTGLVPFDDQFEQFANRLPVYAGVPIERNILQYVSVRIDRGECDAEGNVEKWEPLDEDAVLAEMEHWEVAAGDPIPPAACLQGTTQPLPPVIGGWDASTVGHPRLNVDPADLNASGQRFPWHRNPPPTASFSRFRLFRFFDPSVEPRKTYRYRVQLVMANPNYGLARKFLVDDVDSESTTLISNFSLPSAPQHVAADTQVLAGPMIIPPTSRHPVRARVLVRYWDHQTGQEAIHEFEVAPGERLEADGQDVAVRDAVSGQITRREVDFHTGQTLLAIDGALRPDGRWIRTPIPTRLTLASDDGWITHCDQAADRAEYERLLAEQQALEAKAARPGPPNVLFGRFEEEE